MSVTHDIDNYFNRFDPAKNYEKHLVRAGYGIQSAEINEIQEAAMSRLKGIGDALYKDGDIIRDCRAVVNATTGLVKLESGALYLQGAVRGVPPATFTIPVNTVVNIGVRLVTTVITELDDPALYDPATGTRNYGEPGAGRLQVEAGWGYDGDGQPGEFFGIYTVESGVLLVKDAPPTLDSVTTAIARYDRDSAGGNYIISGLGVAASYSRVTGKVTVLVSEGRARVNGYPIEVPRSLRIEYDADADTKAVTAEPRTYAPTSGSMRVDLDNTPLLSIDEIRYTKQTTATLTRGPVSGGVDALPDNSVLSLVSVAQGATTYVIGTDVKLTSGEVDWSLSGAEPAPGSTYTVTYQHQMTTGATVTGQDDTGFTVSGPVSGSLFTVDYTFALPRIDAMVLDTDGRVSRIKGVATQYNPASPSVPDTQLRIAGLSHTWATSPTVQSDAVVVLPMQELRGLRSMIFDLYDLVSLERLRTDVSLADPTAKRGVFVDPFTNDNLRDEGITQSLAIIDGELILAIDDTVNAVGTSLTTPQLLPYTLTTLIEQPYRTTSMLVNPYQAFDPMPLTVRLNPAVDFWTEVVTDWGSDITRRFVFGSGAQATVTTSTGVQVSSTSRAAQYLRQRYVGFTITGMGSGEALSSLTFDGVAVTPEAA